MHRHFMPEPLLLVTRLQWKYLSDSFGREEN